MNIVQFPASVLTQVAKAVEIDEGVRIGAQLLAASKHMNWGQCAGMAAPQINSSARVFVALGVVYINPWIVWRSKQKKPFYEGCYSLGVGNEYKINRPSSIKLVWHNELGERVERRFYGAEAEIIQHEYDHLEGLLINRGTLIRAGRRPATSEYDSPQSPQPAGDTGAERTASDNNRHDHCASNRTEKGI